MTKRSRGASVPEFCLPPCDQETPSRAKSRGRRSAERRIQPGRLSQTGLVRDAILQTAAPENNFPISRNAGSLFGDTITRGGISPWPKLESSIRTALDQAPKARLDCHQGRSIGSGAPMIFFLGSVGPDDFARNYAGWARKWGLTDWAEWLAQYATGPKSFGRSYYFRAFT